MACFLIDYENQSGEALENISLLKFKKSDEIIFFYSRNSNQMTVRLHIELEEIAAKKTYVFTESIKPNSMDFQLVSYLGARISNNPKLKYYIVSKDRGYDSVCCFWNNKNIFVKRIDRIFHCGDILDTHCN